MFLFVMCTSLLLMVIQPVVMVSMTIPGEGTDRVCPSQESRDTAIQNIRATVQTMIQGFIISQSHICEAGDWYQVAYINMSDPSQQCPAAWREYMTNGVRACGRPVTSGASCAATLYPVDHQYSRVCGRAIGYQFASTDGYALGAQGQPLDSHYVYGVSITHGTPRNHIWTLAAGLSEGPLGEVLYNCPCANPGHPNNAVVPSFVGDNYYCESGNPITSWTDHLYTDDPLWDGQQCEGQCCSNGKSPPWFSVELSNPTTDDIEVRICCGQGTVHDDVTIKVLELYVQ